MSANVGDNSSCPTYAVVNISQKRKNSSKAEQNPSPDIELYSVVDKNKSTREKSKNMEDYHKTDAVFSGTASNVEEENVESFYSVLERENGSQRVSGKSIIPTLLRINIGKLKPAEWKSVCRVIIFMTIILVGIVFAISFFSIIASLRSDIKDKTFMISSSLGSLETRFKHEVERIENNSLRNSLQLAANLIQLNMSFFENLVDIKSLMQDLSQSINSNFNSSVRTLLQRINEFNTASTGFGMLAPAPSCQAIHLFQPSAMSGYYWVRSSNGSSIQVYCEMTMKCDGINVGLLRVALLNNDNRGELCNGSLITSTSSANVTQYIQSNMTPGCSHTFFSSMNITYSHICGTIEGYGYNSTDGFGRNGTVRPDNRTIDDNYVDGISLTYGEMPNRTHIWTFVANRGTDCLQNIPPDFAINSVSCLPNTNTSSNSCASASRCSPYFFKPLQQTTSEDIEMRLCRDQKRGDEDVAIKSVEIYVW